MTVLDDKLVPKVLEIISKFGVNVAWLRDVAETYNPNSGEGRKADSIEVILKMTPPEIKESMLDNVKTSMTSFIVAASGLANVPEINDQLVLAGVQYKIVSTKTIFSGEQIAAYELLCQ